MEGGMGMEGEVLRGEALWNDWTIGIIRMIVVAVVVLLVGLARRCVHPRLDFGVLFGRLDGDVSAASSGSCWRFYRYSLLDAELDWRRRRDVKHVARLRRFARIRDGLTASAWDMVEEGARERGSPRDIQGRKIALRPSVDPESGVPARR
ncbi:hypothetical protein SCHPADRAFT_986952 [Schizopora paradoxa]|uniref:Uncharacterized protein n=1 Tax=Schizopora paradoxa TaxID=27342 RepID=A0A0H2R450_9AGAM|nr:hypothetical protein SCHPADRAFT_986952 [Schizopora paradoxa]